MRYSIILVFLFIAFSCGRKNDKNNTHEVARVHKPVVDTVEVTGKFKTLSQAKVATEILTTSPRYLQLTKGLYSALMRNGGQYFLVRLEGSPYPKTDNSCRYSETYDFTLYEIYVERQLNLARFSFDPKTQLLYEYDEVHEKPMPIHFNRSLLFLYYYPDYYFLN